MSNIQVEIGEITEILSKWNQAKEESLDKVFPKVYETLKRLAKRARRDMGRQDPEETLCTTALANEVYFNLRERKSDGFRNSGHFYAVCLVTMRRMLIDYYFRRVSKTRTEPLPPDFELKVEDLVNLSFLTESPSRFNKLELTILVDELLTKLAEKHPQKAEVLYLKYLLGATENEIAECLGISERTVRRHCGLGELLLKIDLENYNRSEHGSGKSTRSRNIRSERVRGEASRIMLKDLEAILREHRGSS